MVNFDKLKNNRNSNVYPSQPKNQCTFNAMEYLRSNVSWNSRRFQILQGDAYTRQLHTDEMMSKINVFDSLEIRPCPSDRSFCRLTVVDYVDTSNWHLQLAENAPQMQCLLRSLSHTPIPLIT